MHMLCVVLLLVKQSFGLLIVHNSSNDATTYMYGLFDTQHYANLDNTVIGNVYYYDLDCNVTYPRPETNASILLVNSNSNCILQQIALAKQAGYDGILSGILQDETDATISDDIADTGFPVAIIESQVAFNIKQSVLFSNGMYTNYTLSVTGSILAGILVVSFSCFFATVVMCCTAFWSCLCCCLCLDRYQQHRIEEEYLIGNGNRTREELIESIMRHLEQLEDDMGTQIPLGSDQTRNIPKTKYVGDGKEDTCAICVDEFENGTSIKTLPCNHVFHANCIDEWLSKYSSVCPLCKSNLRQPAVNSINNRIAIDLSSISSDDSVY